MNNKTLTTVVVVLVISFVIGFTLLTFSNQGVMAEITDVQLNQAAPRQAVVTMCAPPGGSLVSQNANLMRAVIHVNESTELLDQRKSSPATIRPADLAIGQRVRLWTSNTMRLSEPPQLSATRISVMANPIVGESICAP